MIYIIKHISYNNPVPKDHIELGVGQLFEDDGRDNLNELNLYINEMTGLYDMWKNTKDEYIGLCHYRRLFTNKGGYVKLDDAKEILKDVDIILAPKVNFNMTLYWQLRFEVEDSDILDKYLNEYYSYDPGFKDFIMKEKGFCNREMFICKRDIMEKYCNDVFGIVVPIAKHFITHDKDKANVRLISHIAERYFYYWVLKNNLSVYEMEYKDI